MPTRIINLPTTKAKVLWTSLSTTIGGFIDAQSNARNELLKGWKDLGGRAKLIEGLKSAFEGLVSVIKPIKEAFTAMFPAVTAQRIYELTDSFAKFTSKLKLSDTASQNLKDTFSALFGAVELIGEAFGALWNAFAPVRAEAGALLETILGFTGETGRMVTNVEELIRETPLGRLGTPEDIAYAVAFFASERAGFITGQVLTADGGFIV